MPRRVLKVNAVDPNNTMGDPADDEENMGGFPEDGEEFNEGDNEPEDNNEPEVIEKAVEPDPRDAKIEALQAQLADLNNRMPPPRRQEAEVVDPKDPFDEIDWDQELYNNPKAALKRVAELTEKRTTARLTAQYQQDMNTRSFWSQFYAKNPDLANEDDLVRSTLAANFTTLGGLQVAKAVENLGALTRARIAGYIEKASKNRGPKAKVEGAGLLPNSRQTTKQQEAAPLTLSALMKGRRAKRARAA